MSRIDFQNGFALGLASGGVVESGDNSRLNALESYIDDSGMLSGTEDTLADKVKGLIELSKSHHWFQETFLSGASSSVFTNNKTLKSVPNFDTSCITSFEGMFGGCTALERIDGLNTSNGTTFASMFSNCQNLREVPLIDTSKGTYFNSMFANCKSITTIPTVDVSNGINLQAMFMGCSQLVSIPELNTVNSTQFSNMFSGCTSLETVEGINLTTGGTTSNMFNGCGELKHLRVNSLILGSFSLQYSPKITVDTAKHIICSLKDYSETSKTYTLYLHSDTWVLLDAEGNTAPHGGTWKDYVESLGWTY